MHLFLLVMAVIAIWLFRAYFLPYADCRRCKGRKGNFATRWFGGKRFGPCGSCGGSGSRMVLGSKQVHKALGGLRRARKKKG